MVFTNNNEKVLKMDVYDCFKIELSKYLPDHNIPSSRTFYFVWRRDFGHIKIPKKNRLGACDVCVKLNKQIDDAVGKDKEKWKAKRNEHLNAVREERRLQVLRFVVSTLSANLHNNISEFMKGSSCN